MFSSITLPAILGLLVGIPFTLTATDNYTGWEKYDSREGGFHVYFPKKPVVKTPSSATGQFHVIGIQRTNANELSFSCQGKLKAEPFVDQAAEAAYLKGQQAGAVLSSKGKLIEEKEIEVDSVTGRDFIITFNETTTLRSRAFVFGKVICTITVFGKDADSVRTGDAKKFLESFKTNK